MSHSCCAAGLPSDFESGFASASSFLSSFLSAGLASLSLDLASALLLSEILLSEAASRSLVGSASRSVMKASQRPSGDHCARTLFLRPRVNWNVRPLRVSASHRRVMYSLSFQFVSVCAYAMKRPSGEMRGPATRLMESCSSKLGECLGWAKAAIERTTSARDAETRVRIGKPPKTVRRAADYSVSLADR